MADKKADLAGPVVGDYNEIEKILPQDYESILTPKETQYCQERHILERLVLLCGRRY